MVEAIDPLLGFDWAPPVEDPEVAAAAADGATVTDEPCTFGDRPGVLDPQIFRRPIRTTGHLVVTPSGNVSFHCHAAANAGSFERPLPTTALVIEPVPCFLPDRRRTNDADLVVTPSVHLHLGRSRRPCRAAKVGTWWYLLIPVIVFGMFAAWAYAVTRWARR